MRYDWDKLFLHSLIAARSISWFFEIELCKVIEICFGSKLAEKIENFVLHIEKKNFLKVCQVEVY